VKDMVIVVSAENITTTKKQIEKSRGIDKFKQIYKKDLLFLCYNKYKHK
jgi:hypothetical protein